MNSQELLLDPDDLANSLPGLPQVASLWDDASNISALRNHGRGAKSNLRVDLSGGICERSRGEALLFSPREYAFICFVPFGFAHSNPRFWMFRPGSSSMSILPRDCGLNSWRKVLTLLSNMSRGTLVFDHLVERSSAIPH